MFAKSNIEPPLTHSMTKINKKPPQKSLKWFYFLFYIPLSSLEAIGNQNSYTHSNHGYY